ncbi:MAG TPA: phosphatase, partial [Lachnospiraceae bacterium]|nr:phosphatase [Lachnospiraceae bacterium]
VIASLHTASCRPGTEEENTLAYIYAMYHPCVKIIGHADDGNFPVDYRELVLFAKEKDVLFEINNASLLPCSYRLNARANCITLLSYCMEFHQPVILSSDSHGKAQIGDFDSANALLKELSFPESLLISDAAQLFRYLHIT